MSNVVRRWITGQTLCSTFLEVQPKGRVQLDYMPIEHDSRFADSLARGWLCSMLQPPRAGHK